MRLRIIENLCDMLNCTSAASFAKDWPRSVGLSTPDAAGRYSRLVGRRYHVRNKYKQEERQYYPSHQRRGFGLSGDHRTLLRNHGCNPSYQVKEVFCYVFAMMRSANWSHLLIFSLRSSLKNLCVCVYACMYIRVYKVKYSWLIIFQYYNQPIECGRYCIKHGCSIIISTKQ